MEPYESNTENKDLFEDNPYHLVQAAMGKRFLNYIIDAITFSFLAFIAISVTATQNPEAINTLINKAETGFSFAEQMLIQAVYGLYLAITEALFKGKTLGKLITGTRAVNAEGSPVQWKEAALRGLIRIIPFEQFTALGNPSYPLHDRWAKTYVVDEKLSNYPKN